MIYIIYKYENDVFNINVKHDDTLSVLKSAIKLNLSSRGVNTSESNIKIVYGFPKKILQGQDLDGLTLEELSIFDKEYLMIELIDSKEDNPQKENEGHDDID